MISQQFMFGREHEKICYLDKSFVQRTDSIIAVQEIAHWKQSINAHLLKQYGLMIRNCEIEHDSYGYVQFHNNKSTVAQAIARRINCEVAHDLCHSHCSCGHHQF